MIKKFLTLLLLILSITGINADAASVKDLLSQAIKPIGNCLYVYGGGWNEPDTGAGIEAMTYGISPKWKEFYSNKDASYNHKNFSYQIHNGLDCTGYVGWSLFQIFGNEYSDNGYVYLAKDMAQEYAKLFNGSFISKGNIKDYQSGDVMCSDGHAYIVLGRCDDGSVVLLHASPPAVSICGTYTPNGNSNSQAVVLAKYYMSTYFPDCYNRYPKCSRNTSYLTDYNQMRWNENVLADSDGYRQMSASQILEDLFRNVKIYYGEERMHFSVSPYVQDGTTYVPLRETAERFGSGVVWNSAEERADVKFLDKVMYLNPNDNTVKINNSVTNCTLPITQDRLMIPIRIISNFLDLIVEWEGETESVYLR